MELSVRKLLLWLLSLGLVFTLLRQVFDFMGHVWLAIAVNFLHVVGLIVALFGVVQRRPSFLLSFGGWSLLWLGWNAFLVCYYLNLGQLERDDGILGFGARGSHSFWVEHTPWCRHSFDYAARAWRAQDCYVPFHVVETVVAVFHFVLAFPAMLLALAFLYRHQRKWEEEKAPPVEVEFTSQPHHASTAFMGHPQVSMDPAKANVNPGYASDASAFEVSSGYLNTSYEPQSPSPLSRQGLGLPAGLEPAAAKNPRRSSKKKKKRRSEEQLSGLVTEESVYNEFHQSQQRSAGLDPSAYSLATTAELADGARRTRATSSTRESREARAQRRRERKARSASPPTHRRPDSRTTLESHAMLQQEQQQLAQHHYRQRAGSNSKRRAYKHYATPTARMGGSQPNMLGLGTAAQGDPEGDVLAYAHEPRRLSVNEPRGMRNSTDSALNGPARLSAHRPPVPAQPVTSLVSFDPKSNTLIRYHEHMRTSRDTTRDDSVEDSPPLQLAPTPPSTSAAAFPYQRMGQTNLVSDRTSYDSGIPSSLGGHGGGSEGSSTSSQPSSRDSEHLGPGQPQLKSILASRAGYPSSALPPQSSSPYASSKPNYYEPPVGSLAHQLSKAPQQPSSGHYVTTGNPAFRPSPTSHLHTHHPPGGHQHSRSGSGGFSQLQAPPPALAPVREGVVMAVQGDSHGTEDSFDSSFSIPPPPPPDQPPSSAFRVPQPPAQPAGSSRTPSSFFLPPLSAQLSSRLQRSSDDLTVAQAQAKPQPPPVPAGRLYAPRAPAPIMRQQQPVIHDHSLLV